MTFESRATFETVGLALMLVVLWLVMHGYHGLTGDAQIYAFQAMAKLHPHLSADLYLQYTSQDRFTLFSPLYAWCIGLMGLETAARSLTLVFTAGFLAAVWAFSRAVGGRTTAWAAVALLLIAAGNYGGSGVFLILDNSLTARLPAQALIVTAIFWQLRGGPWLGLALALAALLIHPLMALPGLLFMICLRLPLRLSLVGALSVVIASFTLAVGAVDIPALSHIFAVMDVAWLDVVRERSQFLFLQLWSTRDWETNAKPFECLGFVAIAVPDQRIRRLCAAGALVGAAGLAVALIGGLIGPIAVLVQGQAWRWVWITQLVSVVLLSFAVLQIVRDEKCGLLCALLLILGWALPETGGALSIALASLLWLTRSHLGAYAAGSLRWAAAVLALAIGAWILTRSWAVVIPTAHPWERAPTSAAQMREIPAFQVAAVLLCALIGWGLRIVRPRGLTLLLSAMLAGLAVLIFPKAVGQARLLADPTDIQEFADWASLIPPTSTVLLVPSHDVGGFVWFTLDRPNYLSLDQSAGVVFSRPTALEVRRRSEVLLPLMDPDWKILTRLRSRTASVRNSQASTRPLTTPGLIQICSDPDLGFVISPYKLGFGSVPHPQAGDLTDWNLYDCRKVR